MAIIDDLVAFFVPMTELSVDMPGYRLTAFASSDASYAPSASGGDLAPGPPGDDFELAELTAEDGAAAGFLMRLGQALASGDTTFLFARLHPAVLERYPLCVAR